MPSITKLTRDQLNDRALKLGIDDAPQMPNRKAVIDAIEAAKEAEHLGIWGRGARVVSIFGKGKHRRVLVDLTFELAKEEFGEIPIEKANRTAVVEATEQELATIGEHTPDIANSALAAAALQMAYELDHPFNSATAKANCVNELHKAMDRLRELAAEAKAKGTGGKVDELRARRARRRARP